MPASREPAVTGAAPASGTLVVGALRSGTAAGLAMIPFAAVFRSRGLRINEYGRKTLELLFGSDLPARDALMFVQHMLISCVAAVPLLLLLRRIDALRTRIAAGLAYGALFYVIVNSLALPAFFDDPTPWSLGIAVILPSLVVHLVFGATVAWVAPAGRH